VSDDPEDRDARAVIREYLAGQLGPGGLDGVGDDVDLFDAGLVSSLFAVQIIMWLERSMRVPVLAEDLDMDNVRSVSAITAFVARKRAEPVGSEPG
jgi:acyl carrier protein